MEIFKTGGKETMKKRRFAQLVLMITMLFSDSRIYIRLNHDKIYEAFPMDVSTEDGKTDSSGFCLYLDCSLLAADGNQIEILTGNKDSARIIGGLTL